MTIQPHPGQGAAGSPYLVFVGNVHASQDWVVTPSGTWPIGSVNVTTQDHTATTTRMPTWAIVMLVIFIWFFLLSLLFLLAREERTVGFVNITIWSSNGQSYTESIQIINAYQRADIYARVTYLQGIIGQQRAIGNI